MSPDRFKDQCARLSREDELRFLAALQHELTICVRGCYSERPQIVRSDVNSPIGTLNEVQHWIAGHLIDVVDGKQDRQALGDLIHAIIIRAQAARIETPVTFGVERALQHSITLEPALAR